MTYLRNVGSTLSQAVNVICLKGNPDESISARSYRTDSSAVWFIDALFGKGHCALAYRGDIVHARWLLSLENPRFKE